MDDRQDRFVNVRAAAAEAQVSPRTVRRWLDEGHLTRYKVGPRRVVVAWSELTFLCEPRVADDDTE